MMVLEILILVLILILVPFACGLVPTFFISRNRTTTPVIYLSGLIMCLALFQLMAVPIVIACDFGFGLIKTLYTILLSVMSIAGIVLTVFKVRKDKKLLAQPAFSRNLTIEEIIEWVVFVGIVLFQLVMFMRMASFDGDDAYYVVQSLLTTQTDTLYRIRPYTGLSTSIDLRHSLAVFPIWIAYLSGMSDIHPTIVAHHILGILLIPYTYLIYMEIGKNILRRERNKLPIFMIFVAIMHVFGNVSIYTNATFLMTRTWQGKSLLANVCIPGVIWLLLNIFDSESQEGDRRLGLWFTLFALNIVAAMSSTASVFLIAMLIGVSGLVLTVREKNIQILLRLMITCVPLVVYGAMFLLI